MRVLIALVLSGCATTAVPARQIQIFENCYDDGALECEGNNPACRQRRLDEFRSVEGSNRRLRWLHARGCSPETIGIPATTPRPAEPPAPTSFAMRNAGLGLLGVGTLIGLVAGLAGAAPGSAGLFVVSIPVFGPPLAPLLCSRPGACGTVSAAPLIVGNAAFAIQAAGIGVAAGGWNGTLVRPAD